MYIFSISLIIEMEAVLSLKGLSLAYNYSEECTLL